MATMIYSYLVVLDITVTRRSKIPKSSNGIDTFTSSSNDISSTIASPSKTTVSSITKPTPSSSMTPITGTASSVTASPSYESRFTVSLAEPPYRTVTEQVTGTFTAAPSMPSRGSSVPVAAIVGAVLGSVILCTLLLAILFFIRKRKLTKVYKAPAYPSPYVGGDMTPQLSSKASSQFQKKVAELYRADTMETREPPQLDSREILPQFRRRDSMGRFAELPAEPLPWPGHSAN
ncbi:hypothetical protein COCCADRAFT_6907 [Bipolaris zeicola 26-R-13]|uniref:Uncharacterized protein n=1 Tax=Cochliobolus carbonum (strain 26-R-13) TaxID=930089 RepID=W6Y0W7_COCC2|nr:uncharacterized protein COCCADRAFT_6907 [Bipolaris zeicola 26-R-13]EUC31185.1 hypothetical protein COCCADRAFT_6907 [Bipolaris zeicola 26-R-13]